VAYFVQNLLTLEKLHVYYKKLIVNPVTKNTHLKKGDLIKFTIDI